MKKIILVVMIFAILSLSAAANLGVYEPGDGVTFSVVCLENGGKRDSGCSAGGVIILSPLKSLTALNGVTETFAEVSDASQPGLWFGNFSVPAAAARGTWSIFINLTNSNSTPASTALQFQVVSPNRDFDSLGDSIELHNSTVKNQFLLLNTSLKTNLSNDNGFFSPLISTVNAGIQSNATDIKVNATAAQSNTLTILDNQAVINANLRSMNLTILGNITNAHAGTMTELGRINLSILVNVTRTGFSATVSSSDQNSIATKCAGQVYRQNGTITFIYNFTNSSLNLLMTQRNFTGLGILVNESYNYNNLSMLNRTEMRTENG